MKKPPILTLQMLCQISLQKRQKEYAHFFFLRCRYHSVESGKPRDKKMNTIVTSYVISCDYNGKHVEGMVIAQKDMGKKGTLLTIMIDDKNYRSIYYEKATNVVFKD